MNMTFDSIAAKGLPVVQKLGALYVPSYVNEHNTEPNTIKEELLALDWETRRSARREYFMSETTRQYRYGAGESSELYNSRTFSFLVHHLMAFINRDFDLELNVCFLNRYEDEKNHLGWHADQFPGMRDDQPIVVASFGAEREIWVKDKRGYACFVCRGSGRIRELRCTSCQGSGFLSKMQPNERHPMNQRFWLEEGSLFIMPPGYQDTHMHRIPKHDRPCGWRISLTFRSFV